MLLILWLIQAESQLKHYLHETDLQAWLMGTVSWFLLDLSGQPTVDGTTTSQVDPGFFRKTEEYDPVIKTVNYVPLWVLPQAPALFPLADAL